MKYFKHFLYVFIAVISITASSCMQSNKEAVESPDKDIVFSLSFHKGQLYYQISYKGKIVIDSSVLGLTVDNQITDKVYSIGDVKKKVISDTFPWRGAHSTAVNYCNDAEISILDSSGYSPYSLEVRVFNDGVAFRYVGNQEGTAIVNDDQTEFNIPPGSVIWSQPSTHDYEGTYQRQRIEDVSAGQTAGPPLTIKLPEASGYMAITEGGLTDFPGMSLVVKENGVFKASLAGIARKPGNVRTPWRVIEIGRDLNTLVNCDILANVSPAANQDLFPDGFNTAWIVPGKAVWSWMVGDVPYKERVTFDRMKKYSKLASELGFEYNLVDSGWWAWHKGDKDRWELLRDLVAYSDSLNVKIWVWKNYQDRNGIPGLKNKEIMRDVFRRCKETGVAGLKIDYLGSEKEEVIKFYGRALREAAKMHLMIDFHGAAKPTGTIRTWPNEMTREGVRGLEYLKLKGKTDWPTHNTTLPFTRFLAGHADYTPLSFDFDKTGTSLVHQIASMAIFNSSFMCLAADPQKLLNSPARKMVQALPVTWDETVVLPQSSIGELAIYARRKGETWYLASMNGHVPSQVPIKLSFLGNGTYKADLLNDQKDNPAGVEVQHRIVNSQDSIRIRMNAGGGFAGRFVRE
jgi:alpha-glucosidase